MTIEEAQANIGQPFKWVEGSGATGKFDVIRKVVKGWVYGDFLAAPLEDCRLKLDQPDHLKKHDHEESICDGEHE